MVMAASALGGASLVEAVYGCVELYGCASCVNGCTAVLKLYSFQRISWYGVVYGGVGKHS